MASCADLVVDNIRWRLTELDLSYAGRGLQPIDPDQMKPEDMAGCERLFWVEWDGEDLPEGGVSDITERIADHRMTVQVIYSKQIAIERRTRMMLQDRHDIIKCMRDVDLFNGHAKDSTASTGLLARWVRSASRTGGVTGSDVMEFELECTIQESEI